MRGHNWLIVGSVFVAAILMTLLMTGVGSLSAAPLAAPTPAVSGYASGARPQVVTFWSGDAITATGGSAVINVALFQTLDVQYVVDVGTVNTTTVKLQFSNDETNWADGVDLAAAVVADANAMQQFQVFGVYARFYATVTGSDAITWTVTALAK